MKLLFSGIKDYVDLSTDTEDLVILIPEYGTPKVFSLTHFSVTSLEPIEHYPLQA